MTVSFAVAVAGVVGVSVAFLVGGLLRERESTKPAMALDVNFHVANGDCK